MFMQRLKIFDQNIIWGISVKFDGNMKLTGDIENIKIKREKFFSKVGIDIKNVISADPAQGEKIILISSLDKGRIFKNTDGLITKNKNLYLAITVADCLPLYLYDRENKAIGLIHLGWRSVVDNVADKIIEMMKKKFLSNPQDVIAFIGPHIHNCHFEIKSDVISRFNLYKKFINRRNNRIYVDLGAIVKAQLLNCGLISNNIKISQECTYCKKDKYFSFRQEKVQDIQAMVSYIGMLE